MSWQASFRVIIRVIFIFAYIAFLAASIRHVATFFHNFEADQADWVNPYTLAVSIDLTSLVLTVGVMFFRKNMPWYAQSFTWLFIVALTAFSWFVNWEYAMTYQGNDLRINDSLRMLNPILASSFAFLNLAYSVVAEFFSSKNKSAAEMAAEMDELEQLEAQQQRLSAYKERTKKTSVIQRVKNTAIEAREAAKEVLKTEETTSSPEHKIVASPDAQPVLIDEHLDASGDATPGETEQAITEEPNTDPSVALPVSLQSRVTIKLDATEDETDAQPETQLRRNTDDLMPVSENDNPVSSSVASERNKKLPDKKLPDTEAVRIMRRMINRNWLVEPAKLAEKAGVSTVYARQVKRQVLSDMK